MPTSPGVVVSLSKGEAVFDFTSPKLFLRTCAKLESTAYGIRRVICFRKMQHEVMPSRVAPFAVSRE